MKNYLYKTILGISLLAVISCDSDSDFLKEDPETFYTVDNAFSSAAQVDAVLVTCYAKARNIMINDNSVVLKGNGTDVLDVPTFRATDSFADYSKVNANNGKINTLYSGFYQLVASANYLQSHGSLKLKKIMQSPKPNFLELLPIGIWGSYGEVFPLSIGL